MARNKFKFTTGVVFIVLLIGANILLLMPQKYTKRINYFFVKITSPLQNLAPRRNPQKNDTIPKAEYEKLLEEYYDLQTRLEIIIKRERNIASARQDLPLPGPAIVMANVSKIEIDGQRNELVINKGSVNGIKVDQFVLSPRNDDQGIPVGSIIGRISEVTKTMARVKLVTDANLHIDIDIWRDGKKLDINGRSQGNNKLECKIPLTQVDIDVRKGDAVFALRHPGYLEKPVVIGIITERVHDENMPTLWDITVTPICNIRALKDVAVVIVDMESTGVSED